MHRFFIPSDWIQGNAITLRGALVHQVCDVLRMQPDDTIVALDDSGWEYNVRLTRIECDSVSGLVERKSLSRSEPRAKLTLYQSMLKGQHFEWALQKGTELGIVEFVPMISDRCVISSLEDVTQSKIERWKRIVREAAEQSRRGRLPRLQPAMLFPQACERARGADMAIVPWEEEGVCTLHSMLSHTCESQPVVHVGGRAVQWETGPLPQFSLGQPGGNARRPFSIHIFIGPEGGFTTHEIDQARRYGLTPVSLGPRILRAETAGLVAATMVLYHLGDL